MKVCIDKKFDGDELLTSLFNSYNALGSNLLLENDGSERSINVISEQYLAKAKEDRDPTLLYALNGENRQALLELAIWRNKMWPNGSTIKVKFLGGSKFLRDNVKNNAVIWSRYANLNFEFIEDGDAEIRVSFDADGTSWSAIGLDCLNVTNQHKPTMNFGWFNDRTTPMEFSGTVLHEFGHAIGCIHEHQSPGAGILWDVQKVYDYYAHSQGWDKDMVDFNVLDVYTCKTVSNSTFDPQSIMLYPIDRSLTTNGYHTEMRHFLSMQDIAFIKSRYPGR